MEPQSPDPLPSPSQPIPEPPADTPLPSPASDSFLGRGLVRLLYTNNPFYVISAALVMYGLKRSFQGETLMTHPWHLLGILGGYLLLLSVTAWAVVRFGKVWEDGRMIVLLVLLLLQALAVSFDGILLRDPATGQALLIAGLGLAVALCEGLMWALAVRLPAGYRLPLHLLLAVFFLYPLALVEMQPWGDEVLAVGVLLFPVAMGAGFLTLLPAVRRGPDYVPRSTPWGWPLFPWTLFAFLAFGASVRTWYLTISFLPGLGLDSPFGIYFLIPLLLAGAVLLLEWGIVAKNAIVQQIALAATVVMILMAVQHTGPDPAYREFIVRLTEQAASPLYLSLVCAVLFVLYALARRVPAERWLVGLLLLGVFVGPETQTFARLADMQIIPMAALAIMSAWYAWRRPSSLAALAAVGACLAVLAWATRGTRIMDHHGLVLWHLFAAAALAIRFRYRDLFARLACDAVGIAIAVWSVTVATTAEPIAEPVLRSFYLASLAGVAGLAAWRWASLPHLIAATFAAGCVGAVLMRLAYVWLETSVVQRGLDQLVAGLVFFLLAALVSLAKAGLVRRAWIWCLRHKAKVERLHPLEASA